jgi:hypothetical protein
MKNNFILPLALVLALAGCSKPATDKPADAVDKDGAKSGVMMDAETQARVGLKIESPAATLWQPEIRATGRVVDPLQFVAAVAEYETSRATGSALAQKTAAAKFTADWGVKLAAQTNLLALADALRAGEISFARLAVPASSLAGITPGAAEIFFFGSETNGSPADFSDDLGVDPQTQTTGLLYSTKQKWTPSVAVTARVKIATDATAGVTVPASAIVRHEGKAWVYVQSATNHFDRVEVPLDFPAGEGWFVKEGLSATNRIVTVGAQAVLSAEFTTGEASHDH